MDTTRTHVLGPSARCKSKRSHPPPATGTMVITVAQAPMLQQIAASALTLEPLVLTIPPTASTCGSPPGGFLSAYGSGRREVPRSFPRSNSQPVMIQLED